MYFGKVRGMLRDVLTQSDDQSARWTRLRVLPGQKLQSSNESQSWHIACQKIGCVLTNTGGVQFVKLLSKIGSAQPNLSYRLVLRSLSLSAAPGTTAAFDLCVHVCPLCRRSVAVVPPRASDQPDRTDIHKWTCKLH